MAIGITCNNPPPADIGVAYSHAFPVTGDTPPDVFDIPSGALPAGLTIDSDTGIVSGTPTGPAGTSNFAVRVTDSTTATATINCSITVNGQLQLIGPVPSAYLNVPYFCQLRELGGDAPVGFSVQAGMLPPGISLNITTGVLSGTPTIRGAYNFTIRATDGIGTTADLATSITVFSTAQAGNQGPVGVPQCC